MKKLIKLVIKSLVDEDEEIFVSKLSGRRVRENWLFSQLDCEVHFSRKDPEVIRLDVSRLHLKADSDIPKSQILSWEAFVSGLGWRLEATLWRADKREGRLLAAEEVAEKLFTALPKKVIIKKKDIELAANLEAFELKRNRLMFLARIGGKNG